MKCPSCEGTSKVLNSRIRSDHVYRLRKCIDCNCRFETEERHTAIVAARRQGGNRKRKAHAE